MSLDVSLVLNSGHSCRGLEGLALAHVSTHQLRNGVEIAALIPGRGSSALRRPIGGFLRNGALMLMPPLCVSNFYRAHTDTSARCIFSGLHYLRMRTLNAARCFRLLLKAKLCAGIKEGAEGGEGTS